MRFRHSLGKPDRLDERSLIGASLVASAAFAILTVVVWKRGTRVPDHATRRVVGPRRRRRITAIASAATNVAAPHVHPLVSLALGAVATHRNGRIAYGVPLASVAATIVDKSMRTLIHQKRPPLAGTHHGLDRFAYPSGHTCATTAISIAFTADMWPSLSPASRRAVASLAVLSSLGVAWTRLYLDEHWIDDILGGWLAGTAIGCAAAAANPT